RVRYVRDPQALADADLVILPGSKNTLGDLCWLRESGMAHAVEQARQRKVPLLGICGGYQMLGETIIDEVESGLGAQPGLGVLKTVTHFAQHKTTTQVQATLGSALPDWLADAAGLRVSGYEIHMGETRREAGCPPLLQLHKAGQAVDDGAISNDGLAFGTYLHGLFDSDAFTRALLNGLRQRKGLAPLDSALEYARYKTRQFDRLAEAMREHIAIDKIYAIMRQHQEPLC
ncbi:cobyric acid synthase CobQ, partial [Klebsiella pneumoniae]